MKVITNKAKCLKCGDIIESTYTHDFKWCSCKSIAVDGGRSYLKRSYKSQDDIEDMSITAGEVILEINEDDGGLEITLLIEEESESELSKMALSHMQELAHCAMVQNQLVFKYEFTPYRGQDYRYSFKVDSSYDTDNLDDLIEELREYDTFRLDL